MIETTSASQVTAAGVRESLWYHLRLAHWLWVPLLAFAFTRLGIALLAYLAAPMMADSPTISTYHLRGVENTLLDVFASRWDTGFYLSIAEEGYRYYGVPLPSVPFFPLLPLQMRLVAPLVGDAAVAGILVSNVALLGASVLFYRLVNEEWGAGVAERAVWYLLIFPTSFFGSAIYSESLFLLGAIGAFYLARRGYWESAGMLAFLTALTRFLGILVAPLLALEWWRQWRENEERPSPFALLTAAAAPLGTLSYMGFLHYRFGDALAFVHGSAAWAREPRPPLTVIAELFGTPTEGWRAALLAGRLPLDNWIDFSFVLFFLTMGSVLLRQRRWGEAVFVLLGVFISFNSGLLMSQRRYMWVLFPVFILLARWGERRCVDRAITLVFLLGLGFFTVLFANWYWVA